MSAPASSTGMGASRARRLWRDHASTATAIALYVVAGVVIGAVWWNSYQLTNVNVAATLSVAAIGWVLIFGLARQLSLGHAVFLGVGGYAFGLLTIRAGVPVLVGMLAAVAAATIVGAVLAFPLLRVRGLFLAIATLALALIAQNVATSWISLTGGGSGLNAIPGWQVGSLSSTDSRDAFVMLWSIVGVLWLVARMIWRSPLGKATLAASADEPTATSLGLPVARLKAKLFTLSAAYAGLSGALFASYQSFLAPTDVGTSRSIDIVVYGIVGGPFAPAGSIVGTGVIQYLETELQNAQSSRPLIFGGVLVLAMMYFQGGVVGQLQGLWARLRRASALERLPHSLRELGDEDRATARLLAGVAPLRASPAHSAGDGVAVRCNGVTRRYGGVVAVADVSFEVARGEIFAIIGPNGAGKTTLINTISGFGQPTDGEIAVLGGSSVGVPAGELARRGVRRTFQTPHLIGRLSVLDNIALGLYGDVPLRLLDATLARPRSRRMQERAYAHVVEWADRLGVASDLHKRPHELPAGHQRLVEVARALVAEPALVLLDEPAAGLNSGELELLTTRLRGALRSIGAAAIVIDHQMAFIQELADRVLVLDHGRVLAEDAPDRILLDPKVAEAYLGKVIEPVSEGVR